MSRFIGSAIGAWMVGLAVGVPLLLFGLKGFVWFITNLSAVLDWING